MRRDLRLSDQHVIHGVEIAIASHYLPVFSDRKAERPVGHGGFDGARCEEHPAVIGPALVHRRRKPGFREGIRQIGADRGAFSHDLVAMNNRRKGS